MCHCAASFDPSDVGRAVEMAELVCPSCGADLDERAQSIRCTGCRRSFPIVAGIADLRLAPDRYLSFHDDRRKAERLESVVGSAMDVVDAYWSMTPEVPRGLAATYRRSASRSVERGSAVVHRFGRRPIGSTLLDVGCGTGGLAVAAAQRGFTTTGIDVALRWLVICRRLAADHGVDVRFIAADGAISPFRREAFTVVTCIETIEHAADPRGTLNGSLALAQHAYLAVVANRFSLVPDPTLGLAFAGYLPRRYAPTYVGARRGTRSAFYAPPSLMELATWLGPDAPERGRRPMITSSPLPPVGSDASIARRTAAQLHDRIVGSGAEPLVRMVTPMLSVAWQS